jgi:hypothetical protein
MLFCLEPEKIWRWTSLNYRNKSKRRLFVLTALTVVAIASVLTVYAVTIGTFQGGEVTIGVVDSSTAVTYSLDNNEAGTWTDTIEPSGSSSSWYSRLEISAGDYSGPVTITWQLQQKTGPTTWTDVAGGDTTTTITLSGGAENVYATNDGAWSASNYDWSTDVSAAGTYRVVATVESA